MGQSFEPLHRGAGSARPSIGATVTELPVSREGLVNPADLETAIRPETRLASVMAANNVTGTIQPIAELAGIAHHRGVRFHTDAVQAVGKMPFDLDVPFPYGELAAILLDPLHFGIPTKHLSLSADVVN